MPLSIVTSLSMSQIFSIFFKCKTSSEFKLIFMYFWSYLSELLVIYLIIFLILSHSLSYLFNMSLLSSVETSVKYLLPLISSMYPFIIMVIRYIGLTTNFCIAKIVDLHVSNVVNNNIFVWFLIYLDFIWIFDIIHVIKKRYVQFLYLFL